MDTLIGQPDQQGDPALRVKYHRRRKDLEQRANDAGGNGLVTRREIPARFLQ
ncbi:MAG: hypothetical protein MZV64_19215 [Ignavibacteriales bacterium]|nr:hypothetical protein [Ignavibacteriales bacterium]